MDGVYNASTYITYNYTYRDNNITCEVSAGDELGLVGTNSSAAIIANTQPSNLSILYPNGETVNNGMYLSWIGPYDDVDSDFITLEIQVDNESGFNASNDPQISFSTPTQLTVGGTAIPNTQMNPDVYMGKIVYEDYRTGTNWDIYMYDTATDTETPIATSTANQTNPQIYGDYVLFEQDLGGGMSTVFRYDIDTAVTIQLITSINTSTMDYFGRYVVYNDGTGVKLFDVVSGGNVVTVSGMSSAANLRVYGRNLLWTGMSDSTIWMYDYATGQVSSTNTYGVPAMFGWFRSNEYNGNINITNMFNSSIVQRTGSNATLSGGNLVFETGGNINVTYLIGTVPYDLAIGAGANPAMHEKMIAFERSGDIYYAEQVMALPTRLLVEDPISASYVFQLNSTSSIDGEYLWRIKGCDNAFDNNSCVWGINSTAASDPLATNYSEFTIDNTPPTITGMSPSHGSIVAGQFRIYANIADNLGTGTASYANYTLTYTNNGTLRFAGQMSHSGTLWKSLLLDFLDLSLANLTLTIRANDSMDNWASASVNFTINNATPWFLFGGRGGTEIIDNTTVFNDSIDSDFVAFTVNESTIRIVGPLPATNTRFVQSKQNSTVTNHNYSDPISTLTWPDGQYRAEFLGVNFDGSNAANRTFFVDHNAPQWSNNHTIPNGTVYATDSLYLLINWTDARLSQVNLTYSNPNINNATLIIETTDGPMLGGEFTSSAIDISAYVNRTFTWWSVAVDYLNRTTTSSIFTVFVESDHPQALWTMPDLSTYEDTLNTTVSIDLSAYFYDPNTQGQWASLDNLTYSIVSNCTALAFGIDQSIGLLSNMTSSLNYTGDCDCYVNATDYYWKSNMSSNFSLFVSPVNDAPSINTLPQTNTVEDSPAIITYSLGAYTYDVDGDAVTFQMPLYNTTVFTLSSYDISTGEFNFTLNADAFGVHNITFRVSDAQYTAGTNATINITAVNDVPVPGNFTAPAIGSTRQGTIGVTWNPATDKANEAQTLNYYLAYSTTGGAPWTELANYTTLGTSTSYSWNSSSITEQTITLRLNVSDGTDIASLTYGTFDIDNLAPQITINMPTTIVVSNSFTTDITTHETADCSFALNGTSIGSTTGTTSHAIAVSGLTYNVTYNLSMACIDSIPNTNRTYKIFEPRETALEFIQAYASPSWLYQNQNVNISLEMASNNTVTVMSMNVVRPSGATQALTENNFEPEINASNKIAHLNGLAGITTSEIGKYNLSITLLRNSDLVTIGPLPVVEDIFEVFAAVNQTLNVIP
jgi:beta propeller repeat protein